MAAKKKNLAPAFVRFDFFSFLDTNRISQLVRTVNVQRPTHAAASFPAAMKRDGPISINETPESMIGAAVAAAAAESPAAIASDIDRSRLSQTTQSRDDNDNDENGVEEEFDVEKHWPITPRACLILMKILHAQTAEIVEQGSTDADFYEAASYYHPAAGTLSKCMDMADRGYENIVMA